LCNYFINVFLTSELLSFKTNKHKGTIDFIHYSLPNLTPIYTKTDANDILTC